MTVADSIRAAAASLQREIADIDEGIRRLQERRGRLAEAVALLAEHAMAAEASETPTGGAQLRPPTAAVNGNGNGNPAPPRDASSLAPRQDPYGGGRNNGATAAVRAAMSARPGVWLTAQDVRRLTGLPGSAVGSGLGNLRRSGEVTERQLDPGDRGQRGGGRGARLEYCWEGES